MLKSDRRNLVALSDETKATAIALIAKVLPKGFAASLGTGRDKPGHMLIVIDGPDGYRTETNFPAGRIPVDETVADGFRQTCLHSRSKGAK